MRKFVTEVYQTLHVVNGTTNTVNSCYLKLEVHPKLLISESKFSGSRKFTFQISVALDNRSLNKNKNRKLF